MNREEAEKRAKELFHTLLIRLNFTEYAEDVALIADALQQAAEEGYGRGAEHGISAGYSNGFERGRRDGWQAARKEAISWAGTWNRDGEYYDDKLDAAMPDEPPAEGST